MEVPHPHIPDQHNFITNTLIILAPLLNKLDSMQGISDNKTCHIALPLLTIMGEEIKPSFSKSAKKRLSNFK